MSKYKGFEILDMTDQQLADTKYDMDFSLANRDNRLRDAKERHKIFDFQTINPAFLNIQKEIETELQLRKARG